MSVIPFGSVSTRRLVWLVVAVGLSSVTQSFSEVSSLSRRLSVLEPGLPELEKTVFDDEMQSELAALVDKVLGSVGITMVSSRPVKNRLGAIRTLKPEISALSDDGDAYLLRLVGIDRDMQPRILSEITLFLSAGTAEVRRRTTYALLRAMESYKTGKFCSVC